MRYKTKRIGQILIGIAAVLGLSVSSIAACACEHHGETQVPSHLCHNLSDGDHSANSGIAVVSVDESCVCAPQTAKLSVKSKYIKLKKHRAVFDVARAIQADRPQPTGTSFPARQVSLFYRPRFSAAVSSRGPPAA
jgi:hypothetical protein